MHRRFSTCPLTSSFVGLLVCTCVLLPTQNRLDALKASAADLAAKHDDQPLVIDAAYVDSHLGELAVNEDLSRYIL